MALFGTSFSTTFHAEQHGWDIPSAARQTSNYIFDSQDGTSRVPSPFTFDTYCRPDGQCRISCQLFGHFPDGRDDAAVRNYTYEVNSFNSLEAISFSDVRSAGSTSRWKRLKSSTRFLWMILCLQIYNSTRLKNSITCNQSHLSLKTTPMPARVNSTDLARKTCRDLQRYPRSIISVSTAGIFILTRST
jgi:hypothetical protein